MNTGQAEIEKIRVFYCCLSDPEFIKLFSCSTQLSMKFKSLIDIDIAKMNGICRFKSTNPVIYHAYKCYNAKNCWHFNINEQDKFLVWCMTVCLPLSLHTLMHFCGVLS